MEICFKYKSYRALFAIFHEKGVVDGLGGFIKRSVWGIIYSQDHTVSNASEYADLARQKKSKYDILYITESKVQESKLFLQDQYVNVGSYSGCSQMHHCFKYYEKNIIHMPEVCLCEAENEYIWRWAIRL